MNHEAIDRQLIELLRLPVTQRSPEHLSAALTNIAAAADVEAVARTMLQQEQLKLLAIAELLSQDLKTDINNVSLELALDERFTSLSLWMQQLEGGAWVGRGNTAEEALRDLHEVRSPKAA